MAFPYDRRIFFQETDAAGVVFFAHFLSFCHEAYEASLVAAGIELSYFFGTAPHAFPIVQSQIDFLKPVRCGDTLTIFLRPEMHSSEAFLTHYQLYFQGHPTLVAQATIHHCCIDRETRKKQPVPDSLQQWITLCTEFPDRVSK